MQAINFHPGNYHPNLNCHRKQGTLRLGDKTDKYGQGDIVWITVGKQNARQMKIFTAVIDQIVVKEISQLTFEDLQAENPGITTVTQMIDFLATIYGQEIDQRENITVIYFSEIYE